MSKEGVGFLPGHASLAYFFLGASAIVIAAFCITGPAGKGSGAWCTGALGSVGDETSGAEVIDIRGLCCGVGDVGLEGPGVTPVPGRLEYRPTLTKEGLCISFLWFFSKISKSSTVLLIQECLPPWRGPCIGIFL